MPVFGPAAIRSSLVGWMLNRDEVIFDPYRDINSATSPFGFTSASGATRSGRIITLTGAAAFLNINSDLFPAGRKSVMWEGLVTMAATQKFRFNIRNDAPSVLMYFELDATTNQINVSGLGISTAALPAPASLDLDYAFGLNVAIIVLQAERKARLWLRYYDEPNDLQVSWYSDEFQWDAGTYQRTNEARSVQILTDAAASGTVAFREPVLFEPTFWNVGSSLVAGSDAGNGNRYHSPFPGYDNGGLQFNREWDEPFLRGRALSKWGINAGVAGGGLTGVQDILPLAIWARARVAAGDWGLTNPLNDLDYDADPATNRLALEADLETEVDTAIAAGIVPVLDEVIARNWSGDDAAKDAQARAINATMAGWARTKGVVVVRHYDETLGVGTLPDVTQVIDGSHPSAFGKRIRVGRFLRDLAAASIDRVAIET